MRSARVPDRATRWLAAMLGASLAVSLTSVAVLVLTGESASQAWPATASGYARQAFRPSVHADSWEPMLLAYTGHAADSSRSLYAPFFEKGIKFQYPPTSLLPLTLVSRESLVLQVAETPTGVTPAPSFRTGASLASMMAIWLTFGLSVAIFEMSVRRELPTAARAPAPTAIRAVLGLLIGIGFYPIVAGHALGQVQTFLTTLVAVAVLSWLLGAHRLAGVCLGLCCLFKPQYALVLVWALMRRHREMAVATGVTLLVAGVFSVLAFGWSSHADYLTVLRSIGSQGETFWPNQSVNGVLNRFLYNGDFVTWNAYAYAPYSPLVHAATLGSSLVVIGALLLARPQPTPAARAADWLAALLVATMASPVAWEHHYGILLPLLAAGVPFLMRVAPFGRATGPLVLIAAVAAGSVFLRPELFTANRVVGLALSHLFFGSLVVLIALLRARHLPRPATNPG